MKPSVSGQIKVRQDMEDDKAVEFASKLAQLMDDYSVFELNVALDEDDEAPSSFNN